MNELYLCLNCGSSSLKFSLYIMPSEELVAKKKLEMRTAFGILVIMIRK